MCDNHVSVIIIKYKKIQINKTESPLKSVNIIINGDEADDLEKDEAFALEELNDFLFKFLFSWVTAAEASASAWAVFTWRFGFFGYFLTAVNNGKGDSRNFVKVYWWMWGI